MMELDLTVTTASQAITATTTQPVPSNVQYMAIANPHATASVAFTLAGTPAVGAKGVTLGPLGSMVFDGPPGATIPLSSLTLISSTATQSVTVFYM